ncbi:MAG: amidohydrolase family protein, partial [Pseudomonadota bacterium]
MKQSVLFLFLFFTQWVQANDLLLKNFQIIDPASERAFSGHISVNGEVIVGIYPVGTQGLQAKKIIEGNGRWLLPGFHDMHLHNTTGNTPPYGAFDPKFHDFTSQEKIGHRLLYSGVTTYLDLGAPSEAGELKGGGGDNPEDIFGLRKKQQKRKILHPHLFAAGPLWIVPGSHPMADADWAQREVIRVETEKSGKAIPTKEVVLWARQRVETLVKGFRPNVIKFIYDNPHGEPFADRTHQMPIEVAQALIEEAAKYGIKSVAHVGSWKAVRELSELGVSAITHLPMGEPTKEVTDAMLKSGTVAITTMAVIADFGDMKDDLKRNQFVENLLFKVLTPVRFARTYLDYDLYSDKDKKWVEWASGQNQLKGQEKALMGLARAGVPILSGSDGVNSGSVYGYSLHRELVRMKLAGLDSWSILRTTTSAPAQFLGATSGQIQEGALANFVILKSDPVLDIENTQDIDR